MSFYIGDAITEIKKIKPTTDGHLDFSTLPEFVKKMVIRTDKDSGKTILQEERDIGATISMLTVAIQQLTKRIEDLEKHG
jgi:hypothetical protein